MNNISGVERLQATVKILKDLAMGKKVQLNCTPLHPGMQSKIDCEVSGLLQNGLIRQLERQLETELAAWTKHFVIIGNGTHMALLSPAGHLMAGPTECNKMDAVQNWLMEYFHNDDDEEG